MVGEVKQDLEVREVRQFDLVCDEVAVEAFEEGWTVWVNGGVTEEGVWGYVHVEGELDFSFGAEDAGGDLRTRRHLSAVVGHLSVEEPHAIGTSQGEEVSWVEESEGG